MGSMRFMSCPEDLRVLPKFISFDSSPGRAISRALGDLDENTYEATLKEESYNGDIRVMEIRMRRESTESSPGPHPLKKVGVLTWTRPTV